MAFGGYLKLVVAVLTVDSVLRWSCYYRAVHGNCIFYCIRFRYVSFFAPLFCRLQVSLHDQWSFWSGCAGVYMNARERIWIASTQPVCCVSQRSACDGHLYARLLFDRFFVCLFLLIWLLFVCYIVAYNCDCLVIVFVVVTHFHIVRISRSRLLVPGAHVAYSVLYLGYHFRLLFLIISVAMVLVCCCCFVLDDSGYVAMCMIAWYTVAHCTHTTFDYFIHIVVHKHSLLLLLVILFNGLM